MFMKKRYTLKIGFFCKSGHIYVILILFSYTRYQGVKIGMLVTVSAKIFPVLASDRGKKNESEILLLVVIACESS